MNQSGRFHHAVTWLVIGTYAILASGLPLPVGGMPVHGDSPTAKRLAAKDRSTPFPCMDKPCGCATAEQCFTSCCCHTPAETLAWARARGVEPAVIAALQRRMAAAAVPAEPSCCEEPSCGETSAPGVASCRAVKTTCCATATAKPTGNDPADSPDESIPSKGVSLRAMLACGGILAGWFSCVASLPPEPTILTHPCTCIGRLPCIDESASPVRAAPDAPPPRLG